MYLHYKGIPKDPKGLISSPMEFFLQKYLMVKIRSVKSPSSMFDRALNTPLHCYAA